MSINSFHFDKPAAPAAVRQWSDQRKRLLEDQLPDAIEGILAAAKKAREFRLAAEEVQRIRDEIERRRKIAEINSELSLKQEARLRDRAAALHELNELTALAAHVEREAWAADGYGLEALRERLSQMISGVRESLSAARLRDDWSLMQEEAERRRGWVMRVPAK